MIAYNGPVMWCTRHNRCQTDNGLICNLNIKSPLAKRNVRFTTPDGHASRTTVIKGSSRWRRCHHSHHKSFVLPHPVDRLPRDCHSSFKPLLIPRAYQSMNPQLNRVDCYNSHMMSNELLVSPCDQKTRPSTSQLKSVCLWVAVVSQKDVQSSVIWRSFGITYTLLLVVYWSVRAR